MAHLIVAADLSALGDATRSLGGAVGRTDHREHMPSVGHAGTDGALGDFHSAMSDHCDQLAGHTAEAARSMSGFLAAFQTAGD